MKQCHYFNAKTMQLNGAIARNSGQSWYSGIKSNSIASSLSGRYSAAIARYFFGRFCYRTLIFCEIAVGHCIFFLCSRHTGRCATAKKLVSHSKE